MTFDDVLEQTSAYLAGKKDSITIANNWSQGRTVYGGISSAVLFACVADKITDERPIKTMNVNFVGPLLCDEPFTVSVTELRVGRNVSQLLAMAQQKGKNCVVLQACFAKNRESKVVVKNVDSHDFSLPKKPTFIPPIPKVTPKFLRQFDLAIQDGGVPFTGQKTAHYKGWFRFKKPTSTFTFVHLVGLLHAYPPTLVQMLKWPTLASTNNWNVEFLESDTQYTSEDWFAYHDITRQAEYGYGITEANVWNHRGELIAISRQRVGIFE